MTGLLPLTGVLVDCMPHVSWSRSAAFDWLSEPPEQQTVCPVFGWNGFGGCVRELDHEVSDCHPVGGDRLDVGRACSCRHNGTLPSAGDEHLVQSVGDWAAARYGSYLSHQELLPRAVYSSHDVRSLAQLPTREFS